MTVIQTATGVTTTLIPGGDLGPGTRAMVEVSATFPGAVTAGSTIIAAIAGQPGADGNGDSITLGPSVNATSSTSGGSLSGAYSSGTLALYFGSNRALSTDTVSRGTLLQQGNDGSLGSGCLYTENVGGLTSIAPAFQYSVPGAGNYEAVVTVLGATSLRGSNFLAQATGTSFTITFPAGTVAGDLAVLCFGTTSVASGVSSGWTTNQNSGAQAFFTGAVFSKVLTSGDITTGSVTVNQSASGDAVLAIATFAGTSPSVLAANAVQQSSGSSSVTITVNAPATYYVRATYTGFGEVPSSVVALYFGSNRALSVDTVSRGTLLQQGDDGSIGSGCLYAETLASSGALSATFSYATSGAGNYQAIALVDGGASLRGSNFLAQSTGSSFTINFPAGTVAGDLAVLFYGSVNLASGAPSGWTTNQNSGSASFWTGAVFSKVLTSGDITTGSVTVNEFSSGDAVLAIATLFGAGISLVEAQASRRSSGAASMTLQAGGFYATAETCAGPEVVQAVAPNNLLVVTGPQNPFFDGGGTGGSNPNYSDRVAPGASGWNLYVSTSPGAETKQNSAPLPFNADWTEPTSGLIAGSSPPTSPVRDSAGTAYTQAIWVDGVFSGTPSGEEAMGIFYATGVAAGTHSITIPLAGYNGNPFFDHTAQLDLLLLEVSGYAPASLQSSGFAQQNTGTGTLSVNVTSSGATVLTSDWGGMTSNAAAVVDLIESSADTLWALLTGDSVTGSPTTPTLTGSAYTLVGSVVPGSGIPLYLWFGSVIFSGAQPYLWIVT